MAANSLSVSPLVVGIDASNLRGGGGVTHLAELLLAANPAAHGVDSVVIWASQATLAQLEERHWLVKRADPVLEAHYLRRAGWQRYRLGEQARAETRMPAGQRKPPEIARSFITDRRRCSSFPPLPKTLGWSWRKR